MISIDSMAGGCYQIGHATSCDRRLSRSRPGVCARSREVAFRVQHPRAGIEAGRMTSSKTKKCAKCGKVKRLEHFPKRGPRSGRPAHLPSGRGSSCNKCAAVYQRERRRLNAPKRERPDRRWARGLSSLYDINEVNYAQLLKEQSGVCAICGKEETRKTKYGQVARLSVDHCHESGRVRGLLCQSCNVKLGSLSDPQWLTKALGYLFAR